MNMLLHFLHRTNTNRPPILNDRNLKIFLKFIFEIYECMLANSHNLLVPNTNQIKMNTTNDTSIFITINNAEFVIAISMHFKQTPMNPQYSNLRSNAIFNNYIILLT